MTKCARRRATAAVATVVLLAAACTSTPTPTPTTTGATGPSTSGSSTPPTSAGTTTGGQPADDPVLDSCDPIAVMPCQRQVAFVALPIAGSATALTYASDRAPGRTADVSPSAAGVGLGGWTLSVLDTLDPAGHTEITGTGVLRHVTGVPLPGGSVAVADPTGTRISVFDASGRETALVDSVTGAAIATFAWVKQGLASVSDAGGVVLTVTRAADGTPSRLTVRDGANTTLGVQGGQLAGVGYPNGTVGIIHTAPGGLVDQVWDGAGIATQFRYDGAGRLIAQTTGAGATTSYQRTTDSGRLVVTTTLPSGGQQVDTVARSGSTVTRTHTDAGDGTATQVEDGDHRSITTPDGRLLQATLAPDPRWGSDAPVLTQFAEHRPGTAEADLAQAETSTAARGSGTAAVAVDRTITVAGNTWHIHYDPGTRTATVIDPTGVSTTTVTDAAGRVTARSGGGAVASSYSYDGNGRVTSIILGTGPDARTWRYAYSPYTITTTDPVGGVQVRTVDAAGRTMSLSGPGSQQVTLSRDGAGRVTGFAGGAGGQYQLTRRADGALSAVNSPAGQGGPQFTGFTYDAAGRPTGAATADTTLTIDRNAAGAPISVDAGAGTYTAAYDALGRLTTWTGPGISTVESYTGPYVTSETMSGTVSGVISRTVDALGRTASESVDGTDPVDYAYDAAGRLTAAGQMSMTLDPTTGRVVAQKVGSVTESFTSNQFGETTRETVTRSGGTAIADIAYRRDGLGRMTNVTTTVGRATSTTSYSYDASGRLASENTDGKRTSYSYDVAGNLVAITDPAGKAAPLAYDGRNALVRAGDVTYAYDGAGQLKAATAPSGTTTYAYDAAGALRSVTAPGKPKISYTVDGFGRRVASTVGGTVTQGVIYRDPLRVAAITDGSGKIIQRFVYTGASSLPAYAVIGGTTYAEIPDAAGGPALVIDAATGAVADRTVRTALGATVSETHPGFQAIGFAAGLADPGTSLVRFGARDYDTSTGRWAAPDPLLVAGGSANLYEYVGGDPVNRSDHAGQFCDYASLGITIGGGAGGAYGSTTIGIATAGGQLGVFNTNSVGAGFGGGVGVTLNCMDNDDSNNSPDLNDFAGPGASAEASLAGFTGGGDVGYGPDGKPSSHGGHVGFGGDGIGGDLTRGNTEMHCLFGCDPSDPGGGSDPANQVCGNLGCAPTGPDGNDIDPCAGGGCDPPGSSGPGGGRTTGDPHLFTMDHTRYDMQGAGEFTALASDSGDLQIQVRQQPFPNSRSVSLTTAIAMSLSGDRLMIDRPAGSVTALRLTSPVALPPVGVATLPHGARIRLLPGMLVLTTTDGGTITIRTNPTGLDLTITLPDARKGHVHGLLGPFTGASFGTAQTAGGQTLTTEQLRDYNTLYRTFADSWRITAQASLFTYDAGKSTASYTDKSFPDPHPAPIAASVRSAAEAICRQHGVPDADLADCILDVATTGDAGFADSMATALGIVPGGVASDAQVSGQMLPGQTVTGTLSAGTQKVYAFTVPAGLVGYFAAAPGCTPHGLVWDIVTVDNAGLVGASDVCNDIGRVQFVAAGDYRLRVSTGSGGSGSYSLTWRQSRPDRTSTVAPGQTVSGSVDLPGAQDYYTFQASAGTVGYYAAAAGSTCSGLQWWIDVRSGDGWTPFIGATGICNDLGRILFPQTAEYRISLRGADLATGPYSVTWRASRPDAVRPLSAGQQAQGTIDRPGAHDVYTMNVPAGTVVYLAADPACTDTNLSWVVQSSDGADVIGTVQACDDLGRLQFAAAGVYQLVIEGSGPATGSYRVNWVASRPDRVEPLPANGPVTGTIDRPGARDVWSFTGSGTVALRAAAGCPSPGTSTGPVLVWWVQQVGGIPITATVPVCTDLGTVTLPSTGEYQVVVGGQGAVTGSYGFTRSG